MDERIRKKVDLLNLLKQKEKKKYRILNKENKKKLNK